MEKTCVVCRIWLKEIEIQFRIMYIYIFTYIYTHVLCIHLFELYCIHCLESRFIGHLKFYGWKFSDIAETLPYRIQPGTVINLEHAPKMLYCIWQQCEQRWEKQGLLHFCRVISLEVWPAGRSTLFAQVTWLLYIKCQMLHTTAQQCTRQHTQETHFHFSRGQTTGSFLRLRKFHKLMDFRNFSW